VVGHDGHRNWQNDDASSTIRREDIVASLKRLKPVTPFDARIASSASIPSPSKPTFCAEHEPTHRFGEFLHRAKA
jgi:hypothetical protein